MSDDPTQPAPGGEAPRPPRPPKARLRPPDKAVILTLPPFAGLSQRHVHVPQGPEALAAAGADLLTQEVLGFDTESKPTFVKGEQSTGPDVVQFATATQAYVFQLCRAECLSLVAQVLAHPGCVKLGFGLQQDQAQLRYRLGVGASPVLDLDTVFKHLGYPPSLGIKAAVAVLFGQRFVKSKRITTTNWAQPRLDERQVMYAANDAWVALQVWRALTAHDAPQRAKALAVLHKARHPPE
jgi:ribonuclease D